MVTIYHGTPLTPRAALLDVCSGRAMCVSFFRPDDAEAVEAISPTIMFRQRSVFVLAGGFASRRGMDGSSELEALLRLVGAKAVHAWALGDHAGHSGGAVPAQRCGPARLAFWRERSASLAHGRAARKATAALREASPRLPGLDWSESWIARLSRAHGGSGQRAGQPVAGSAHAARDGGRVRLPVRQRGQHQPRAERMAVRHGAGLRRSLGREAGVC